MFSTVITYNNAYSILDSITVKMGNEDITRRCVYAYGDYTYHRGSVRITVYGVSANISITIKDLTYTPQYALRLVTQYSVEGENWTSWILSGSVAPMKIGSNAKYRFDSNDETLLPTSWTVGDSNILEINTTDGLSTPTFIPKSAGSTTVTIHTNNSSI